VTQTISSTVDAPAASARRMLLGEQTAGTLVANIAYIYRHHFGLIVGAVALPLILPLIIITAALSNIDSEGKNIGAIIVAVIGFALGYVGLFLGPAALTVVASDICVGNTPTLKRAYDRILGRGRWWHMVTTSLLAGVLIDLAMILLIVPGLWLFVRAVFSAPAVVLEDRRNRDAIRRSFALTKGQVWRLAGLLIVIFMLAELVSVLIGYVMGYVGAILAGPHSGVAAYLPILSMFVASIVTGPAISMLIVLLYYDQRVRRESYDAQALAEDLMR
jgi:membrane-anchored glycerophosphoryl diester phosphodiesterase (GDPDase)